MVKERQIPYNQGQDVKVFLAANLKHVSSKATIF